MTDLEKSLLAEARFLTDRLSEFESAFGNMDKDVYRGYAGHIHPSIARLRSIIYALDQKESGPVAGVGGGSR